MRTASLAIALAAFASTGACTGGKPASPPRSPTVVDAPPSSGAAEAESPPPRQAVETSCGTDGLPPRDMIAGNVVDTEMSGMGTITSAKVTGTDGSEPAPTTGYVHFVYELDIVRQFTGERLEHVRLIQGAEAGAKPQNPGAFLFFSACIDSNGNAYEPDVGYVFPMDPACEKQVGEMAASAAKSQPDAEGRGSACREE